MSKERERPTILQTDLRDAIHEAAKRRTSKDEVVMEFIRHACVVASASCGDGVGMAEGLARSNELARKIAEVMEAEVTSWRAKATN